LGTSALSLTASAAASPARAHAATPAQAQARDEPGSGLLAEFHALRATRATSSVIHTAASAIDLPACVDARERLREERLGVGLARNEAMRPRGARRSPKSVSGRSRHAEPDRLRAG
jgi:hypothetical protein